MGEVKLSEAQKVLARKFVAARASSAVLCDGPEAGFRPRHYPRLAGEFVRPTGSPTNGYGTREAAIEAARKFKDECRAALASNKEKE